MTAGELALVVATVLCALGFAALVVILVRVLDGVRTLHDEVAVLRAETAPLIAEMRASTREARATLDAARADLARFDRVLGSAEAISDAVAGTGRVARSAFSTPVIKATAVPAGTGRAVRRLRRVER